MKENNFIELKFKSKRLTENFPEANDGCVPGMFLLISDIIRSSKEQLDEYGIDYEEIIFRKAKR